MKLHRFYINQSIDKNEDITLADSELISQWRNVLRFRAGDKVVLFNGSLKEFHGTIEIISKDKAVVSCDQIVDVDFVLDKNVSLFMSMIKKDKAEWVLQKCTEIGVSDFIPVISNRTEKINLDVKRAEKIIKEAVEQSGRATLPSISEPINLSEALNLCETNKNTKCFYLQQTGISWVNSGIKDLKDVSVFVGPEGGWTLEEEEIFSGKGIIGVSLGKNILRAETASVAAMSVILLG